MAKISSNDIVTLHKQIEKELARRGVAKWQVKYLDDTKLSFSLRLSLGKQA